MKSTAINGTIRRKWSEMDEQGRISICNTLDSLWPFHKVHRRLSPLKNLSSFFLGKYNLKALSQRINLQFSTYSAGRKISPKASQSMSIVQDSWNEAISNPTASSNYKIEKNVRKMKWWKIIVENNIICAQNEALWSQSSRVFSLIGYVLRNMFSMRLGIGEFHQQNHVALTEVFTKMVTTFCSFSILMLGCRFSKKWQSTY